MRSGILAVVVFASTVGACSHAPAPAPAPAPQHRSTVDQPDKHRARPKPLSIVHRVRSRYGQDLAKVQVGCEAGDADACYVAGGALRSKDPAQSQRYFAKACANEVEDACFLAAWLVIRAAGDENGSFNLEKFRMLDVSTRREFEGFMDEGCRMIPSDETCRTLSELRLKPGEITGMLPTSVGGVRLGATEREARDACVAGGSRYMPVPNDEAAEAAICLPAPLSPFSSTSNLMINFCGGRACEISFGFEAPTRTHVEDVLARFVEKYGEPKRTQPYYQCPNGDTGQFRAIWLDRRAAGYVMVNYGCPVGESVLHLSVHYTNREGAERRRSEAKTMRDNF